MKSKEEIIRLGLVSWHSIDHVRPELEANISNMMDDYTSELRAELDEVKITAEALVYRNKELNAELEVVKADIFKPYATQNLLMDKLRQLNEEKRSKFTQEEMKELEDWANTIIPMKQKITHERQAKTSF